MCIAAGDYMRDQKGNAAALQFYCEILYYYYYYIPTGAGWSTREGGEGYEKYSGKYHSHRLGKYNNVNPSRPTGRVGGYNWRNVNEPGIHGSVRIFSSPLPSRCRLCREATL